MSSYYKINSNSDERGSFIKTYQQSVVGFDCKEIFLTSSVIGVARGLHYQFCKKTNRGASRLMTVTSGCIVDFIAKFDPITKKCLQLEYSRLGPNEENNSVHIAGDGKHCHGFIAIENSLCIYASSQIYKPESDFGFDILSIDYDFAGLLKSLEMNSFVRSERDLLFAAFCKGTPS